MADPTAIEVLQGAWEDQIALISDPIIKAEATYLLTGYIAALQQQAALDANTISSYTIGGRTVTRRDAGSGRDLLDAMAMKLRRYCYGSTTLIDMRINES